MFLQTETGISSVDFLFKFVWSCLEVVFSLDPQLPGRFKSATSLLLECTHDKTISSFSTCTSTPTWYLGLLDYIMSTKEQNLVFYKMPWLVMCHWAITTDFQIYGNKWLHVKFDSLCGHRICPAFLSLHLFVVFCYSVMLVSSFYLRFYYIFYALILSVVFFPANPFHL